MTPAHGLPEIKKYPYSRFKYIFMKIKKGDTVLITAGKDKGRTGKILRTFLKEGAILVEGINLKKKHVKPKKQGEKGQVISTPAPLNVSNIKIVCPKCGKATRIEYKVEKEDPLTSLRASKHRVCKKCKSQI